MAADVRVFVSYSHGPPEHQERVLAFAEQLRADGIDVHLDQYETSPPQGWPQWMLDHVELANFVLVVCTETYHQRFRGKTQPGSGRGVKWEGAVLTQTLYDADSRNERFIPVIFASADADHIPVVLRGATRYVIATEEGYEALYRHLTGQPAVVKGELGSRRVLPPRGPAGRGAVTYESAEVHLPVPQPKVVAPGQVSRDDEGRERKRSRSLGRRWLVGAGLAVMVAVGIYKMRPPAEEPAAGAQEIEATSPPPSSPPAAEQERVHVKDGTVLVYVPGGEYPMGADDITDDERPPHRVRLSPFWIGKYEVSNAQYQKFLDANPRQQTPEYWNDARFNQPQQPVVGVSWQEASDYCAWAGLELPTEAQWEAAARGPEGRRYPWGNNPPTAKLAEFGQPWETGRPAPLGSRPRGVGPFGTLDQAGNVWEWCADVWNAEAYQGRTGQVSENLIEMQKNNIFRAARGDSWASRSRLLSSAYRDGFMASSRSEDVGFRCVSGSGPRAVGS